MQCVRKSMYSALVVTIQYLRKWIFTLRNNKTTWNETKPSQSDILILLVTFCFKEVQPTTQQKSQISHVRWSNQSCNS